MILCRKCIRETPVKTHVRDLATLDFRLLVVFDSLARLGSVSATARALDIPQPAVSQGLRRLRLLFDDELFLRVARRMEPTPLAASLREPIASIVEIAREHILRHLSSFRKQSRREFRIAATDFGAVTLLALLLPRLSATAPDVRLRLSPMDAGNIRRPRCRTRRSRHRNHHRNAGEHPQPTGVRRSLCVCDASRAPGVAGRARRPRSFDVRNL